MDSQGSITSLKETNEIPMTEYKNIKTYKLSNEEFRRILLNSVNYKKTQLDN